MCSLYRRYRQSAPDVIAPTGNPRGHGMGFVP